MIHAILMGQRNPISCIFTGSVTSTRTVDSFCNFCVKIFIRVESAQARYICTGSYVRQKEQCYLLLGCKEASIPIKISYGILNITVISRDMFIWLHFFH